VRGRARCFAQGSRALCRWLWREPGRGTLLPYTHDSPLRAAWRVSGSSCSNKYGCTEAACIMFAQALARGWRESPGRETLLPYAARTPMTVLMTHLSVPLCTSVVQHVHMINRANACLPHQNARLRGDSIASVHDTKVTLKGLPPGTCDPPHGPWTI